MAEIKSALELAMEKSRKYSISDTEREEIKRKETFQRAMSLFYRYREGSVSLSEMEREIEKIDEKLRESVKAILISEWVQALSLENHWEKEFEALEAMKDQDLHGLKQKFQRLLSAYRKQIEETRQRITDQLLEQLREQGIEGEAIEPNLEGNEGFEKEVHSVADSYRERLDEVKRELRRKL